MPYLRRSLPVRKIRPERVASVLARQKGYTLLELAIIAMFLGLLSVFSIQQLSTTVTYAYQATALRETTRKLAEGWNVLRQVCGVSSTAVTTTSLGNGTGTAAVNNLALIAGLTSAAAGYAGCYNSTGLRPLYPAVGGTAVAPKVLDFDVSWTHTVVNGNRALILSYAGVPDEVVLSAFQRYSHVAGASGTAVLAAATTNTTDAAVRFTASVAGKRTLSLIHPL